MVAVVVTFQDPEAIRGAIKALREQTVRLSKIVVVDNGHDLSLDVPPLHGDDIHLVRPNDNLGAAGGFAAGVRAAIDIGAALLFLINDDDRPFPNAVETLVNAARRDCSPGSLAVVCGWGMVGGVERRSGGWMGRGIRYPSSEGSDGIPYEVDITTFSCILLRSDWYRAVGGIKPDYFMMWEEYDLMLQLRRAGGRILVVPQPLFESGRRHGLRNAYPAWRGYYGARNGIRTLRALGTRVDLGWFLAREVKIMLASIRREDRFLRIGLLVRGVRDGFRGTAGRTVEPS